MPKLTTKERTIMVAAVRTGRLRKARGGYVAHGEYDNVFHPRTVLQLARGGWLTPDVFDFVPSPSAMTWFGSQAAA